MNWNIEYKAGQYQQPKYIYKQIKCNEAILPPL